MAEKYTGSYGSGTGEVTIRYLGEQTWEGRKLMLDFQGRLIARVRGTTLVETFEGAGTRETELISYDIKRWAARLTPWCCPDTVDLA